jgi:hypothetical protein
VAFESNFEISVFEQVSDFAYMQGGEGEDCPFYVVFRVCGWCCAHYFALYLLP